MRDSTAKIIEIMRNAAEIISSHDRAVISSDISSKEGSANYVTVYDVQVQKSLTDALSREFPDADFLCEENTGESDRSSGKKELFIIDPIDGTTNFIHNTRHSAISVAYATDGKVTAGCVLNPYTNELFYAEAGGGAYLQSGSDVHKISVSDRGLSDALIAFGTTPYNRNAADETFNTIKNLFLYCRDIRRLGSAALDLCYVACGRFDFFFETKLSPWDFAAAQLIVSEAGGIVTDKNGSSLQITKSSYVIAGNKPAYDKIMEMDLL